MDNTDAQGTVRYGCTIPNCSCTQYSSPKGLKCTNCGHVPPKHSDKPLSTPNNMDKMNVGRGDKKKGGGNRSDDDSDEMNVDRSGDDSDKKKGVGNRGDNDSDDQNDKKKGKGGPKKKRNDNDRDGGDDEKSDRKRRQKDKRDEKKGKDGSDDEFDKKKGKSVTKRQRDDSEDSDREYRKRTKSSHKENTSKKDKFSNKDVKGIKRFGCKECQCDGFWWKETLPTTKCSICDHMPASHSQLTPDPKPVSPAPKKQFQNTTNLDRNRKPREKCKCGKCDGYERFENGSDCVHCFCFAEHHPMKEYGKCQDSSCSCTEYTHDVKRGPFDCECGHKVAKHKKLTLETKPFVLNPSTTNSAPKPPGQKKCGCGKDVYVDPKTGQSFDKCGNSCPGVPASGGGPGVPVSGGGPPSSTTKLCQKCNKKPVFGCSKFCSITCRDAK